MSTASRVGAAFGAGLLGFMLLSSPAMAGPEGKDSNKHETADTTEVIETPAGPGDGETDAHPGRHERQTENGNSGTQGKSTSNPDGEPGVDKPYAADGFAAGTQEGDAGPTASNADDFDGNNGCGNDTDFADDNNGNCGGVKAAGGNTGGNTGGTTGGTTGGAVLGTTDTSTQGAQVLGVQFERAPEVLAATAPAESAQVLGMQIERGAPASLAMTGFPIGIAVLAGFGLIGGGFAARRVART